jgi:hypothetical protein
VKLYLTRERQSALLAVCPSLTVPARRVAPPSVSALWLESAFAQAPAAVVPVLASAVVPVAPVSVLVPAAPVAASAIESVRVDRTARIDALETAGLPIEDLPGVVETRKDDQIHVASAAQLDPRGVQVQGTSGFTAEQDMTALKPNGGVRGAPPRGRPV